MRRTRFHTLHLTAVLLLVAAAAPGVAAGQEAGPAPASGSATLTLREAVEAALSSHPALGAATAAREAVAAAAGEARSARLPTLGATALLTRYQEPMVVAPIHGFSPTNLPEFDETLYQGHAVLEYALFDPARGARIRSAARLVAVAGAGVESARDAVIAEAVSSYLAASTAREVAAAHEQRVRSLEQERARVALLLDQGKAPRVAVLRTEAALSRARAELAASDERLRVALRALARTTGLDPARVTAGSLAAVSVDGADDVLPADDPSGAGRAALLATALESNPRLAQAEHRRAAADAAVAAARGTLLPRVALSGRYSAYGSPSTELAPEWNAGVQLSYALFTGGSRSRAIERAEAEAARARAERELAARQVAEAVDGALLAYRSAEARVGALEAAVEQSAEVARIEALALSAGAGVQTDYLRAEAELLEARAALAEARHAMVDARVLLARATGTLTVESVARMTGVAPAGAAGEEGVER